MNETGLSLEHALSKTQADAEQALKAAALVTRHLKRSQVAAAVGDLHAIRASLEAAEKAMAGLRQQVANTKDGWAFDEQMYFETGMFARELIEAGQRADVNIVEQDRMLCCYPTLTRVVPSERLVKIDKKIERRVRPSVLAGILKRRQENPPKARPEKFLEVLYEAYTKVVAIQGKSLLDGQVVPLVRIYELLTIFPGMESQYPRQEFVRDVYLLHKSGIGATKTGAVMGIHFGRDFKTGMDIFTDKGQVQRYYGVSFTNGSKV